MWNENTRRRELQTGFFYNRVATFQRDVEIVLQCVAGLYAFALW